MEDPDRRFRQMGRLGAHDSPWAPVHRQPCALQSGQLRPRLVRGRESHQALVALPAGRKMLGRLASKPEPLHLAAPRSILFRIMGNNFFFSSERRRQGQEAAQGIHARRVHWLGAEERPGDDARLQSSVDRGRPEDDGVLRFAGSAGNRELELGRRADAAEPERAREQQWHGS